MTNQTHPYSYNNQPIGYDATAKVIRFKENNLLRMIRNYTVIYRNFSLNEIAVCGYSSAEMQHLSQLGGYSVSAYGSLSYCEEFLDKVETLDKAADEIADHFLDPEDFVANKRIPIHESVNGIFLCNRAVRDLVQSYGGLARLADEVGHIYSSYDLNEFSQIAQLTGCTFSGFQTVIGILRQCTRYSYHVEETMKMISEYYSGR